VKALFYNGAGGVEWREQEPPALQESTDALVQPVAVTTCDLDQAILRGGVPGSESPFAIGHEGIGEVIEIGDQVSGINPGDIVVIPYHVSCGCCDRCLQGVPLYCRLAASDGLAVYGMPVGADHGGLFSEMVRVPFASHSLVTLPPGLTPVQAVSTGDNLTDAWRAVAPHLKERPGADVLIMSTCPTGILAADVAQACGAGRVRYVDRDRARLELAESLGAETGTLAEFEPDEHEYDIAVNASDSKSALRNAVLATAPGGHCESMAFHFSEVPMPLLAMHLKCVHFRSSLCNARSHIPDVLALLASGAISPELIQTALLPFHTAAETLLTAGNKPVYHAGSTRPT
jgi:threonine dehydrogenase-like Zn-dependent dehydrogenase